MGLTQKGRGFLRLLSDDEIRKIHYGTLNILEEQGVKFLLPEARQIFADAGLEVSKEGVVRFPSYVVEDAIKKAPSRFTRYPLHPSYPEVDMGSDSLYIMPGSTPRYILDLETGKQRLATKPEPLLSMLLTLVLWICDLPIMSLADHMFSKEIGHSGGL